MFRKKKVIVGLSGGVDSAVSAYLLKQEGYEVTALFMKNWEEDEACPAAIDFEDVASICRVIGIPYYSVNFAKEYKEQVFSDFLKESLVGRTPNPDILCNREIKFKLFFDKAKEIGADYLATGHYCQLERVGDETRLIKGNDPNKDQTYFLYAVQGEVLKEVLFPIGHLPKPMVRKIAKEAKIPVAEKKDSTGICFIGKRDFRTFLSTHLKAIPGLFMTSEGKVIGEHIGLPYYTIGQRRGLAIGGAGEAWFVVGKDTQRNIIFVEQGENHPALFSQTLIAHLPSWIGGSFEEKLPYFCHSKIRYRQQDQPCEIIRLDGNRLEVKFLKPQRAVTPGQSVVFYQGNRCLGGAIIESGHP